MQNVFKNNSHIALHLFCIICIILCVTLFVPSCSKDVSIPKTKPVSHIRKVLIEEFTGHFDGHATWAADTIQRLQKKYPDKVIVVAIHSGFFARPYPPTYTADFQSNEGDDYFTFMGVTFNPAGVVSRIGYPNNMVKGREKWRGIVDSLIPLTPEADIKITNHYNSGTRVLTSSVRTEFLKALQGTYKLVLLLTEDSIVSAQRDYAQAPPYILMNYPHHHVLRDGITSSWGDVLKTGVIAKGDSVIKKYSYMLPANFNGITPAEDRCRVVAYIYNTSSYEVIQAEEANMK